MTDTPMTETGVLEELVEWSDDMDAIAATTEGYRLRLERAGFSPQAAEVMTMQWHGELLNVLFD